MKKRIIFLMFCTVVTMIMSGCGSDNSTSTEIEVAAIEEKENEIQRTTIGENEIEVLSYSYDYDVTTAILLDKKENILYGLVKVTWNNAGSEPGEFFMLVDSEGNPYVYDGNAEHIPELILHKEETEEEAYLMTYVFSDSVYNVRYALLFTWNNRAGAYTGNVITLYNDKGKPSLKK